MACRSTKGHLKSQYYNLLYRIPVTRYSHPTAEIFQQGFLSFINETNCRLCRVFTNLNVICIWRRTDLCSNHKRFCVYINCEFSIVPKCALLIVIFGPKSHDWILLISHFYIEYICLKYTANANLFRFCWWKILSIIIYRRRGKLFNYLFFGIVLHFYELIYDARREYNSR